MERGIRVFLVDDHEMAREGLRRMLELEPDIQVVGEAASAEEALLQVEMLNPDVILMDIKMPTINGLEATRLLKEREVSAEIVILSLHSEYLAQAVEAGAAGYLVKDVKRKELVDAIRRIDQGELVLGNSVLNTPEITQNALGYLRDLLKGSTKAAPAYVHPPGSQNHSNSPAGDTLSSQHSQDGDGPSEQRPSVGPAARSWPQRALEVQKPLGLEDASAASVKPVPSPSPNPEAPAFQEQGNHSGEQYPEARVPDLGMVNGDSASSSENTWDEIISRAESVPLSPTDAATVYESDVELVIAPPVEADALLRFCHWLKGVARADIQETVGSWQEGTSLKVLLRHPLPLLDMLASSPDVAQVWEEPSEEPQDGHRFLVRRKEAPNSVGGPTRRLQVVLKSNSAPKQLSLSFDSPASP